MGSARRTTEMNALGAMVGLRADGGPQSAAARASGAPLGVGGEVDADTDADQCWQSGDKLCRMDADGLCESCNTAHRHDVAIEAEDEAARRPSVEDAEDSAHVGVGPRARGVEEEARQIALILSVTNAHDGRNKHLRERLMVIPPELPVASTATPDTAANRRHKGGARAARVPRPCTVADRVAPLTPSASPRHRSGSAVWRGPVAAAAAAMPPRPGRDATAKAETEAAASAAAGRRPGADRIPPSLGQDAAFLQQIARDPSECDKEVSLVNLEKKYIRGELFKNN